jgi:hypothetical protein
VEHRSARFFVDARSADFDMNANGKMAAMATPTERGKLQRVAPGNYVLRLRFRQYKTLSCAVTWRGPRKNIPR